MTQANKTYFNFLKEQIAITFLEYNAGPKKIADWKGETIVLFQEDLFNKTQGRISEKSFYTYFKNPTEKLPRIDSLNLLSTYVGYAHWEELKTAYSGFVVDDEVYKKNVKSRFPAYIIVSLVVIFCVLGYLYLERDNEYNFCLIDADTNKPINTTLRVEILQEDASSIFVNTNAEGCFEYYSKHYKIDFVIQSSYYKTDTISRTISDNNNPSIPLITDNYALMLKYYSDGNSNNIEKRRAQLENLIANDAQIYQVHDKVSGIELYSKKEFINKLTIPTSSLKNIHIIDKAYKNGQITQLKFIVQ